MRVWSGLAWLTLGIYWLAFVKAAIKKFGFNKKREMYLIAE
jgi:hypothetical protein